MNPAAFELYFTHTTIGEPPHQDSPSAAYYNAAVAVITRIILLYLDSCVPCTIVLGI